VKVEPIVGWNAIWVCVPRMELVTEQLIGDVASARVVLVCGCK
jgi:hypothetical protein